MAGRTIDSEAIISELVQDICDCLDAGYVGLYEFVWTLRGMNIDAPDALLHELSEKALKRIAAKEEKVRGVWLTRGGNGPGESFPLDDLPNDPWADIDEGGRYPGLVRLPIPDRFFPFLDSKNHALAMSATQRYDPELAAVMESGLGWAMLPLAQRLDTGERAVNALLSEFLNNLDHDWEPTLHGRHADNVLGQISQALIDLKDNPPTA